LQSFRLFDFGNQRRQDFVQVARDGVVGLGHDRRVGIGVYRQYLFGATRADHVLDGAANTAGDVKLRRDARAGLPDLVSMGAPAEVGDDARAADRTAEQGRQLFEYGEALGAAYAAPAADDNRRAGKGDALLAGGSLLDQAHAEGALIELRCETLDGRG